MNFSKEGVLASGAIETVTGRDCRVYVRVNAAQDEKIGIYRKGLDQLLHDYRMTFEVYILYRTVGGREFRGSDCDTWSCARGVGSTLGLPIAA